LDVDCSLSMVARASPRTCPVGRFVTVWLQRSASIIREGDMKIAVYGATGRIGSRMVAEAAARGHLVTAMSRHQAALPNEVEWQFGDLADTDAVRAVAAVHDAVVTANAPDPADPPSFTALLRTVAQAVGGTRLIVVGGAGSLRNESGERLVDSPDFPPAWKPGALATANVLEELRTLGPDSDWTYLSPAPLISEGERTGHYQTSDETPAGEWISFDDFALALVDELENPTHRRARFTVASR
jgi:putative NADH-flavin reductase